MKIIPAIDILDGKCVRLSKGDYGTQKIYNENPCDVAKQFEDYGLQYLHLVDLDGARSKHVVNLRILEIIASSTKLKIDFGGGVKSDDDLRNVFACGAQQITAGSIAVDEPQKVFEWISTYGTDKIILGADCRNRKVATHGWLDESGIDIIDFIRSFEEMKIQYVLCTDISKDGMLQGPSIALYKDILESCNVKLIASAGISSMKDLEDLKNAGCDGAIIGKAIYEGRITLKELSTLC